MSIDPVPFEPTTDGLRVRLRVHPGASRDRVEGRVARPDGRTALAVRVTAQPANGRANDAVVKLLAKTWRLPKSAITIVAGHGQRQKTLLVSGDPTDLESNLRSWLAQQA